LEQHTSHTYSVDHGGRRGRDRMVVGLATTSQSVHITTKVVSSNPAHGEVYSILHFVIKVYRWLATGRWFSPRISVSFPNKTDRQHILCWSWGSSWPWSYGSWTCNYLCNQCLSPLILWVRISTMARFTTLCDKVWQWLGTGRTTAPMINRVCVTSMLFQNFFLIIQLCLWACKILGPSWSWSYGSWIYNYL
jgi:hypothetical protein